MINTTSIKIKRSTVPGKVPEVNQLTLGELAINHADYKIYSLGVGIGSTIFTVNPWNVGYGSVSYDINFSNGNVGIGSSLPNSQLDVNGNIKLSGSFSENTYTIIDNISVELNPNLATMQSWTLSTDRSPTANNFFEGQSLKLRISGDFMITWPAGMVWVGDTNGASGTAPAAPTTGWLHTEHWKEQGVLYGSFVGYSAS